jgi:tetratricopeptide (TPR) repeat protein
VERAAARRSGIQWTPDNAEAILALSAKLEGIPLAIELVAAWSGVLTPSQMLARLEAHFAFPGETNAETPERHHSLQQAFDASYALLDEAERSALRRLSVFTGGWTLEAAEAVCGGAGNLSADSTLILLKRLVEKSLVLFQEAPRATEQSRYRLLEMTRQYAQEQLSEVEREEAAQRHADYFLAEALAAEEDILRIGTSGTYHRRMWPDRENYHASLRWWQSTDSEKGIEMLVALIASAMWIPSYQEITDWIDRLEAQPLPVPSPFQARLYIFAGQWARSRGGKTGTILTERGYLLAEGCNDNMSRYLALLYLGEISMLAGNFGAAREHLERSRECAARTRNPLLTSGVDIALFGLHCAEKDFDTAQRIADELLRSGRETAHWFTLKHAFEALAGLAYERKDYARACDYLEQALAVCPETETHSRSNALRMLGNAASRLGNHDAAREALYESLALCQAEGHRPHEGWSYQGLALVAYRQGLKGEAIEWQNKALRLFDQLGEEWSVIVCLKGMAQFFEDMPERAAFLWSACARFVGERSDLFGDGQQQEEIDAAIASLRTVLSEEALATIRQKAASLTLREVVHQGLDA